MYGGDPDECIFVTEKLLERKMEGTTSTLPMRQFDKYPDEVQIVYENIKPPPPEVIIVKEIYTVRNTDMETQPVTEFPVNEPIAPILMPPIDAEMHKQVKTSRGTSNEPIAPILMSPVDAKMQRQAKTSRTTSSNEETVECGICLDTPQEMASSDKVLMSTICGHIFCSLCIKRILEEYKFCPICRKRINSRQVHPMY